MGGDGQPFVPEKTMVPPDHIIWKRGSTSPVSQVVGFPILIHRDLPEPPLYFRTGIVTADDNQGVTYMMIQLDDGLATMRFVDLVKLTISGVMS